MSINQDLFMFGEDIETAHGAIRFLKYSEFIRLQGELNIFCTSMLNFYWLYKKNYKDISDINVLNAIEAIKDTSLYLYVKSVPDLFAAYKSVFEKVLLNQESINLIFESEELFMSYRSLIMDMNMLRESPASPNPEIQEYYELRRKKQQQDMGDQNLSDMVSSIVVATPHSFEDVANMTVIQVNLIYGRISAFKNFDVTTLFATVSAESKIEPWNKHVDIFTKEELGIAYEEFNKKYGGLFN